MEGYAGAEMMERREFIRAAGAALGAGAAAQEPAKAAITSSLMLWTIKGSLEEKLEIAARAGIQSVQLVGEHTQWSEADIARVKKQLRSFRLAIDALSAVPNWSREPVSMLDPAQRAGLLAEVEKNILMAKKLEVPRLLLMSGNVIAGRSYEEQWASLVESAKRAGELAARHEVTLIVEPLNNKVNHKGFFLTTCVDGLKLIREVDNPRVRLLFDIYHEQVQIGNVIRTIQEAAPLTDVFHVADNPGRNDPGTGELNYPNIYRVIAKTGFRGVIAMEYLPLADPVKSLTRSVDEMRANLNAG
ncbi:MAG: TIM barrel protein [Chloroflexi bacterium]|nr:TIM barrel protein [Chloroflexota bacterium]